MGFFPKILFAALALGTFPGAAVAQFTDTFDAIDPAWVTNRYPPAGFASVFYDDGNRLQLTVDYVDRAANRPGYTSEFYNTQGRQRPGGITGPWTLSAQVYVSSAFDTVTGALVQSDLWGHTGTTDAGGAYMILGFTNASLTAANILDSAATDRAFRFEAFNPNNATWVNLGVPNGFAFDTWHMLTGTSTGTAFEYRIDGVLVDTIATTAGDDLLSAMIQGYNFGQAGSYSVYWDNVTASAVPEPAASALAAAVATLGFVCWRRRRAAH